MGWGGGGGAEGGGVDRDSITSALLRLKCAIDCISFAVLWLLHVKKMLVKNVVGSLGHHKNKLKKKKLVSGSPPMLYKLVLVPTPILHTNFNENPLKGAIVAKTTWAHWHKCSLLFNLTQHLCSMDIKLNKYGEKTDTF